MNQKKQTILIVEDEEEIRVTIIRSLSPEGFDFLEASTYKEALLKLEDRSIQLVLMDIGLPDADGFDLLRLIKRTPEMTNLPVIIFTSSSERSDLDRAYRLGANSYVVKPSDSEHLLSLAKCLAEYWLSHNLQPAIR